MIYKKQESLLPPKMLQVLLRPAFDAGCGFYFPISIEAVS
ncbi:hypothetical protein J2Z75_005115 [Rhizobium herbae]|uniref:Uncharacterized protein n=1 Tax=Rhizobium herbae TaxID=508661 RepID=A0ABS4EUF7_9HYPH|nr:hypothetical protein [Rhizobium herbae]